MCPVYTLHGVLLDHEYNIQDEIFVCVICLRGEVKSIENICTTVGSGLYA